MGFILEVMECGQIWKNDGFISIFEFFLAIIQDKDQMDQEYKQADQVADECNCPGKK